MNIKKIKLSIFFLTTNFHMVFGGHFSLEGQENNTKNHEFQKMYDDTSEELKGAEEE